MGVVFDAAVRTIKGVLYRRDFKLLSDSGFSAGEKNCGVFKTAKVFHVKRVDIEGFT